MEDNMYEKQILDAIQLLVDNAINKASFDKTIRGVISKCEDEKNGKYIVIYQDSFFEAYSTDTTQIYNVGTPVYVLVPGNDMRQTKTILGSVNRLDTDYITTIESADNYDIIGNSITTMSSEQGVCSYIEGGDALVLYDKLSQSTPLITIDAVAANTYIKKAQYLVLGGTFRTSLVKEQMFHGTYGLAFDLNFRDNSNGETIKRTYLVNINNMTGNPYKYTKGSNQKVTFNIDGANFIDIDKIYLYCYDFPKTSSASKPDDIFVSDVTIEAASPISTDEMTGDRIILNTPQGVYFNTGDSASASRVVNAETKIDGKIVDNNSSALRYYWFKQNFSINSSSLTYNRYGGPGWECLNTYNVIEKDVNDNPTVVEWLPAEPSLTILKVDATTKENEYKCIAIYNNETTLTKYFTIYNHAAAYEISIESDCGNSFSYDNGSPNLTCSVNQEGEFTYHWGMFDNKGLYTELAETSELNYYYHYKLDRYNYLAEGLMNGTVPYTKVNLRERDDLAYELKQYNEIMRVEENHIYNLRLSMITNFATFVCSVYLNNTYIGRASLTLSNDLNESASNYTLQVSGGNQVYKYNEDGIAPTSKSLDNPIALKPITFELYDEKGNIIKDDLIDANNVSWTIPSKYTMIRPSSQYGLPTSEDTINETETYTGMKSFVYTIPAIYDYKKIRNTIKLEVKFRDKVITEEIELFFIKEGESGSNGTDLMCRVVPNIASGTTAPIYPIVTYDNNAVEGATNPTINYTAATENVWLKAELFKNGEIIFSGPVSANSTEGRAVTVRWEMLKNKYEKTALGATISDVSNFNVTSSGGVFSYNTLSDISDTTLKNSPCNIVKCTVTYDGVDYISTMPLILAKVNNSQNGTYKLELEEDAGFRYAMYTTDGQRPAYNSTNPFAIKVLETINNVETDVSISTDEDAAVDYAWSVTGAIWNHTSWVAQANLIEKVHTLADLLAKNEKDYKPIDTFSGFAVNNGLKCIISRDNGSTVLGEIYLPIHMYLNRYGNAAMNGWDGNHIEINNDGGFILAPQIGAGKKENDNSYTGVFMGSVQEAGKANAETGLFGYNHGERTIALDAEKGSARFGKSGQGQIVIDPDETSAKLYSDNFEIGYTRPSDMVPAQTNYEGGYSYFRKNGNNYTLLKNITDYIEGYYYNGAFYKDSAHTTLIVPLNNQKYYDIANKKCYKYTNNSYQELTNYYKVGDPIKSTDWVWYGGDGLEIDLNDPHITFGSGKFRVDSEGQLYATGMATRGDLDVLASKIIEVSKTVTGVNTITLDGAHAGALYRIKVWGQIDALYPSEDLFPAEDLYPTPASSIGLDVDGTVTPLDINYLNYISSSVYDEYVCEEGKSWIIRRVGTDEETGELYPLATEVIEPREDTIITVGSYSVLTIDGVLGLNCEATYLIENEYTDSFTNQVELVSKINASPEQVEIVSRKISLAGKQIDLTGDNITIESDNFSVDKYGNIDAQNGNFRGNVYLPDGGRVIGGDGLLTNLQYTSVGIVNGWGPIGFTTNDSGSTMYQDMVIDYYIPQNFTPTEAYLTLYTTKVMSAYGSSSTTGWPRRLKLYHGNLNKTYNVFWMSGSSYFYRGDLATNGVIDNAFGVNEYTPTISSIGDVAQVTTINLADKLSTQVGNSQLIIRTSVSKPAAYSQGMAENTGMGRAILNIIGYMSTEEEA